MKKVNVVICCGLNCATRGGQELLDLIEDDPFLMENCILEAKECQELCNEGNRSPVVLINKTSYTNMTPDRLIDLLHEIIKSK